MSSVLYSLSLFSLSRPKSPGLAKVRSSLTSSQLLFRRCSPCDPSQPNKQLYRTPPPRSNGLFCPATELLAGASCSVLTSFLIVPVKTEREVIVCRVRVLWDCLKWWEQKTKHNVAFLNPSSAPPPPDVSSLNGNVCYNQLHSGTIWIGEEIKLKITTSLLFLWKGYH